MSTAAQTGAILGGLQKVNGILMLATTAEGIIVPIVAGLIKELKQKANADGTIEYSLVLMTGMKELEEIKTQATEDLDAIDKILVSKGEKPIPRDPAPASNPSTPSS